MRKQSKTAVVLIAACMIAGCCGAFVERAGAAGPDGQKFGEIERGRYLAAAADCFACHTVQDGGKPYAGGRPLETPFGNITSPNITPDQETGIGAWTDDQFDDAVRKGMRPDGSHLYPAMPFTSYTKMSRKDVLAIRAYLNTVEPIRNPVIVNTLPFPFNIRASLALWKKLYFKQGEYRPDPNQSAEWNRGAYLVEGAAHCSACHTLRSFLGGEKSAHYLQGASLQGWFAPDITNADKTGLGKWTVEDIVAYLKTGHNRFSAATGPMAEEVTHSTSLLSDDDAKAIAVYLKSVAGQNASPQSVPEQDSQMVAGGAIYRDTCSACHGLDGKGVSRLFPSLVGSAVAQSSDPTTAIRVILRGARSVATSAEPTAPGMPSFAWQLNNDQIAAVTTYIRNAWGNSASRVSPSEVEKRKANFSRRTD
ncbi:Gluconate 2-dehydrogenase cytochrome c subunit OS=Afipia felis OX=1035 GN=BN961_00369 PE=4 SV=1 [Afipia felis]